MGRSEDAERALEVGGRVVCGEGELESAVPGFAELVPALRRGLAGRLAGGREERDRERKERAYLSAGVSGVVELQTESAKARACDEERELRRRTL